MPLTFCSLNSAFCNEKIHLRNRNKNEFIKEITKSSPTFIALQEFGEFSQTRDLNGNEIQNQLTDMGYLACPTNKDGKYPVNSRLFYKASEVNLSTKSEALAISNQYLNRQCGGTFVVGSDTISVYSLYLPLASNDPSGKKKFLDDIIDFAKARIESNAKVILCGDLNESADTDTKYPTAYPEKLLELGTLFQEDDSSKTWENQKRLDHIFVSPALSKRVVKSTSTPTHVSDHYMLSLVLDD